MAERKRRSRRKTPVVIHASPESEGLPVVTQESPDTDVPSAARGVRPDTHVPIRERHPVPPSVRAAVSVESPEVHVPPAEAEASPEKLVPPVATLASPEVNVLPAVASASPENVVPPVVSEASPDTPARPARLQRTTHMRDGSRLTSRRPGDGARGRAVWSWWLERTPCPACGKVRARLVAFSGEALPGDLWQELVLLGQQDMCVCTLEVLD